MLPSKGYFKSLNCPYYDSSHCDRPHCHYRHTKKERPFDDVSPLDDNQAETDSNEYLYNILSDKNNENKVRLENHEELWFSQKPKNVSYKPTPISELRKRHLPVTTAPNVIASHYVRSKLENTQKPKAEYKPGSLRGEVPVYKASPIKDITQGDIDDNELLLSNILNKGGNEDDNFSQLGDDSEEEIDFDQISSAFNFLDEFLHEYDNRPSNIKPSEALNNESIVICDKNGSSISLSDVTNVSNDKVEDSLNHEDTSDKILKNTIPETNQTCSNDQLKQKDSESTNEPKNEEKIKNCTSNRSSSKGSKHSRERKRSSSNSSSQKESDHRKVKSSEHGHKRTSEHLSDNNKSEKKSESDVNHSNDKECTSKKINQEHKKTVKKEHDKSSTRSTKNELEKKHSSSSSSRKDSDHKSSSDKSSKDSEHKTALCNSNKKESHDKSRSSKGSKEKSVDSKKDPINSHHEQHSRNNKTKDDSISKKNSSDRLHSSEHKKHTESRHRKESVDKSKQPEKHRKRQLSATESENRPPKKKKQKVEAEIIVDDDDDDDVEIINDPVSIIIIDSEEESTIKEKKSSFGKNTEIYISPSPSPESFGEPILPSDDSLSDMEDENKASTTQPSTVKTDDSALLDHRVMSRVKNRVSLGYTYRPPTKKAVKVMTPSARLMMFRNQIKEQEEQEDPNSSSDAQATARVKIGSVPNVKLLLEEKNRLLMMAGNKERNTEKFKENTSLVQESKLSKKDPMSENKEEPLTVMHKAHPRLSGANKETRQQHIEMMYKAARQLVKPHQQYSAAQKKCLEVEEEIWKRTTHATYSQEMKNAVDKMWRQLSDFTLRYFTEIKARREIMFLPLQTSSNVQKPDEKGSKQDTEPKEISVYNALTKYLMSLEELESEGYPRRHLTNKDLAYCDETNRKKYAKPAAAVPREGEYICVKCNLSYAVDEQGLSIDPKGCSYHLKKSAYSEGPWKNGFRNKVYRCCGGNVNNPCMNSKYHAHESKDSLNLEGFIETQESKGLEPEEGWGVFAIDCEMYWSTKGLELGRVTVVNFDERIVYDTCVRPDLPVADYCTRMSGLTEESLQEAKVTLCEVQRALLKIIKAKTILIGHSLENDLKALKLIHNTVVDTAMVFRKGENKTALKSLSEEHLKEVIQNEEDGHNSAEDAIACIKLMKQKLMKECCQSKAKAPVMKMRFQSKNPIF